MNTVYHGNCNSSGWKRYTAPSSTRTATSTALLHRAYAKDARGQEHDDLFIVKLK